MIKNKNQKLRFATIGAFNTVIDFGILFLLKSLGLPAIPANILSTSVAFCFSFIANRKFTFKSSGSNVKRELFLFIVVTLFGLWVLQSFVIYVVSTLLLGFELPAEINLFISKLLAICVSLVWNYTLYSRIVFKQETNNGTHSH